MLIAFRMRLAVSLVRPSALLAFGVSTSEWTRCFLGRYCSAPKSDDGLVPRPRFSDSPAVVTPSAEVFAPARRNGDRSGTARLRGPVLVPSDWLLIFDWCITDRLTKDWLVEKLASYPGTAWTVTTTGCRLRRPIVWGEMVWTDGANAGVCIGGISAWP